ncbi:MAG: hypothetical protein HWD59_14800 [Coxiellaceae bacterium]|nr:MAG: hypothetical protein HWD59_14800 [Coxiellaceae bacterium]
MKLGSLTIHILHYGIFLPLQQALEKSSPNYQFLLQNLLKSFLDMRYDQFSRFDEDSHSMVINHLFYTTLIEYPSSCGWSPLYEREQRRWMNSVKSLSTDEPTSCIVEGIPETKQRQYLPMTLIDILFKDHELQINPQQKSTESTIIQFQWKQQTFFLKTFPTDTLDGLDQQLAIEYLHRLLGGSSHVALTWPLKLIYQQDEQRKTYYCTVSQEVIGDDLEK